MTLTEQGIHHIDFVKVPERWERLVEERPALASFIYDDQEPIGLIPAERRLECLITDEMTDEHRALLSHLGMAAVNPELQADRERPGLEVRQGFTAEGHRLFSLLEETSTEASHEGERSIENLIVVRGLLLFGHAHIGKKTEHGGLVAIEGSFRPLTEPEIDRALQTDLYSMKHVT